MKTRKRRVEYISFYNHTGLEAHFAKMAKKGWMIESISNLYWTYRRIEPQDIHFCVTYYPKGSDFDPLPSEEQQTFHAFCAHTGWQFACSWHQMQVFYNAQPDPIPLETDPVMEVDTLHRASKKNFLPSHFALLGLGLIYSVTLLNATPITILSNPSYHLVICSLLGMFILSGSELITYYTWLHKARKAAEQGFFMDTPSTVKLQQSLMAVLGAAIVLWLIQLRSAGDPVLLGASVSLMVGTFSIMIIVNVIKQGLKKAQASRGLNRALTLAACFILPMIMTGIITYAVTNSTQNDPVSNGTSDVGIPLSVSDFREVNEEDYAEHSRHNQTFLLGQQTVNLYPHLHVEDPRELPDLRYTITTVHMPFLYDWCKEQMYDALDETDDADIPAGHKLTYVRVDAAPWGAGEAYRLYREEGRYLDWYLLCYDNRIMEIRFDWEPSPADMQIVAEKLGK